MQTQGKLYVMYHDPCLDGIYSLAGMMLPIITKIKKDNWTIQDFLNHLRKQLLVLSDKKPEKYEIKKGYDDEKIEN